MSTPAVPPRLFILHRPETEHALIIRRGPSRQTAFFGWNRRTNNIRLGQWLQAKVYPRRSDLSPDGKYVIYFAISGKWRDDSRGSWTTVSRYPFLKAIDFWPKGDTWQGGGLFTGPKEYTLYEAFGHTQHTLSDKFKVKRGMVSTPIEKDQGLAVYLVRLHRDGWAFQETRYPAWEEGSNVKPLEPRLHVFHKPINKSLTLEKIIHIGRNPLLPQGQSLYPEEHRILGTEEPDSANWQNLDRYRKSIFWTKAGSLYAAPVKGDQLGQPSLIHDFTDYTFEERLAPY